MKIKKSHLSYCTNIHPGKQWQDTLNNIRFSCPRVKKRISPKDPFGLGLWLSAEALAGLKANLDTFKREITAAGMYAFTINAFPYGNFHSMPVKEKVYLPDWSSKKRLQYTINAADVLAFLLPEDVPGSISTVPIAYGKRCPSNAFGHLFKVAEHLKWIEAETGRHIELALEPEPDCFIENTDECLSFFSELRRLNPELTNHYLGICLDTCHLALQFELPLNALKKLISAKINISKIQVASALQTEIEPNGSAAILRKFNDGIYLHQTRVLQDKTLLRFPDLPQALETSPSGQWRIHFHLPLHYKSKDGRLSSTSYLLDQDFFKTAFNVCPNIEIETYTFDVVPGKSYDVCESIIHELSFVMDRL